MRPGIISLISKSRSVNSEGFETVTTTTKDVMASVKSVARTEFYAAYASGLTVDLVFVIHRSGYSGEKDLIYDGHRYEVIRTYEREDEFIELTSRKRQATSDSNPAE